jgi:hypothetical protein
MTATLWNVAAFGWTCVGRQQHANTTVDTWTAGHDVLVLVWENEATAVAAVLNGEVLDTDGIEARVTGGPADDSAALFDRVRQHADTGKDRISIELAGLFGCAYGVMTTSTPAALGGPVIPLSLRARLHNLALAVLSTPAS